MAFTQYEYLVVHWPEICVLNFANLLLRNLAKLSEFVYSSSKISEMRLIVAAHNGDRRPVIRTIGYPQSKRNSLLRLEL